MGFGILHYDLANIYTSSVLILGSDGLFGMCIISSSISIQRFVLSVVGMNVSYGIERVSVWSSSSFHHGIHTVQDHILFSYSPIFDIDQDISTPLNGDAQTLEAKAWANDRHLLWTICA